MRTFSSFKLSQVKCCHLVGSHLLPDSSSGREVFGESSFGEGSHMVQIVPVTHQNARLAVAPLHQSAPTAEVPDQVGQALGSLQLPAPLLRDIPGARTVEGSLTTGVAGVERVVFLK